MSGQELEAETPGMQIRRAVLGDEYVDASEKTINDFNGDLRAFVVDVCWEKVWSRPGLALKTRSLVNIALLGALNRPDELRLHVTGAINNGCTLEELSEVVLHIGAYCGVPAALDVSRMIEDVMDHQVSAESGGGA